MHNERIRCYFGTYQAVRLRRWSWFQGLLGWPRPGEGDLLRLAGSGYCPGGLGDAFGMANPDVVDTIGPMYCSASSRVAKDLYSLPLNPFTC